MVASMVLFGFVFNVLAAPVEIHNGQSALKPLRSLNSAQQIRELSPEQAQRGYPVHLNAIVLDYNQNTFSDLMIQDATAGIYVDQIAEKGYRLHPGQRIELEGVSASGEFAPVVIPTRIKVVGESELPAGRPVSFDYLATGIEDGQWVSVRGIIRSATVDKSVNYDRLVIDLSTSGSHLMVRMTQFDPVAVERLVDAEATITGVCFPWYNRKRQLLNVRLSVPGMAQIQIEKPPPENPFDIPARPINSLMQFDLSALHGHRVKVKGVVVLQQPGQAISIRDQDQGLWVKTPQTQIVNPGEEVEVIGFPVSGEYSPVLENAMFRKTGQQQRLRPVSLTAEKVREGNYDADFIQLEAQLVEQFHNATEQVLVLQENGIQFRAHVKQAAGRNEPLPLQPGSRLQLAGVCLVQLGDQRWPQSFRLILRSAEDITVRQQPSWWTFQRMLTALGMVTLVLLCAMAWAITLQRRVRAQTKIIRQKIQREAVLEERTRIAREFHDTLEQALAGIGMQLEAVGNTLLAAPEESQRILEVARTMVRHSLDEAQRSVWNLRSVALERADLTTAVKQLTEQRNGSGIEIQVKVSGTPRTLPNRVESHLLRIGQEATTNALKHAQPKAVQIELSFGTESVQLSVTDDGLGFDAENATSSEVGHFGLLGMRERAEKIGGTLTITSGLAAGTRIQVLVPIQPFLAELRHEEEN